MEEKGAKFEIEDLIERIVDLGEFETYKMLDLLNSAKAKDSRLPIILRQFFHLYNSGYGFLQDLGLGLGLMIIAPPSKYSCSGWEDLKEVDKKELIRNLPKIDEVIERGSNWLIAKKIVLTGERDVSGKYLYLDTRTDEEKKSLLWKIELKECDSHGIDLKLFADKIRKELWAV